MRSPGWIVVGMCLCAIAREPVSAQMPIAQSTQTAVEAVVGNRVLQARYFGGSPFSGIGSNLDYGVLLTEDREFLGSVALMFDTDVVPLRGLRLQVGPALNLAWLDAEHKTNVFAAAAGAGVRYELIPRIGLTALGSAYYSPGVLTFGNAHNMYDFTAGAEVRLAGRLHVLGGYRWLKFTLVGEPDEKMANELFAGVRWQLD
jgi:hypothetical protein